MINDNSYLNIKNIDFSIYTQRIALNDNYHKKRMDPLAYTIVEFDKSETQTKTSIHPDTQNQFIEQRILSNAPVSRNANAINTISVFSDSYPKNPSGINNLSSNK